MFLGQLPVCILVCVFMDEKIGLGLLRLDIQQCSKQPVLFKVDNFWDLRDPAIQHMLLSDLTVLQPFFTMLSPLCTRLCQYMFCNWGKMDPLTKYELLHQAIGHIDVTCWVAMVQVAAKSYYCIENPEGSQAWNRNNAS